MRAKALIAADRPSDVTITIPAQDRYWVADALYEATRIREAEATEDRRRKLRRAAMTQRRADRLRAIADQVTP